MNKFKGSKGVIIFIILVLLMVSYYFHLSNRRVTAKKEQQAQQLTAVQDTLLRDLNTNYPPTPKEVVKYYSQISQCFYNEEYSEEELDKLGKKALELYDEELVNSKTEEKYLSDLRYDVNKLREDKCTISSYAVSSSTDVDYFSEGGYDCARLYCIYTIKQGGALSTTQEVFILRKDEEGHWKIFGWDLAKPDES